MIYSNLRSCTEGADNNLLRYEIISKNLEILQFFPEKATLKSNAGMNRESRVQLTCSKIWNAQVNP